MEGLHANHSTLNLIRATCPLDQSKTPPTAGEFFFPDGYDLALKEIQQ
jgi:hypothetical protein